MTRSEATQLIRTAGGRVTGSVSGNTDFVVVGDNPGSKYEEALEREISILDEPALRTFLNPE